MRRQLVLIPLLMIVALWPVDAQPAPAAPVVQDAPIIAPVPLAQLGGVTRAIAAADGYAYLGVGSRIATYDVHDPADLLLVDETGSLGGIVQQLIVDDGHLYVRLGDTQLMTLDLSDPSAPVPIGLCEVEHGPTLRMVVEDDWIYLLSKCFLMPVNVSDRQTPIVSGNVVELKCSSDVYGESLVVVHNRMIYVRVRVPIIGRGWIQTISKEDPGRPVLIHTAILPWPMGNQAMFHATGPYAYLESGEGVDLSADVIEPFAAVRPGALAAVSDAQGRLFIYPDYVSADTNTDLTVTAYDVHDPLHPMMLGSLDSEWSGFVGPAQISDGTLFFTSGKTLGSIDVSDPAFMSDLDHVLVPRSFGRLHPLGTSALVGVDGSPWLLDLSVPSQPELVSQVPVFPVAVHGVEAIAMYDGELSIFDFTDPVSPTLQGSLELDDVDDIAWDGDIAVVACGEGVRMLDVGDPTELVQVGYADVAADKVAAYDGKAYCAVSHISYSNSSSATLTQLDISDPALPVSAITMTHSVNSLSVHGGLLFALGDALGNGGPVLSILAIDSVSEPHPLARLRLGAADRAAGLALSDRYAFVATSGGVHVVDLADPNNPEVVQSLDMRPTAIALSGDLLLVSTEQDGLCVLQLNGVSSLITLEAEDALIEAPMSVASDPAASGGMYVSSGVSSGSVTFEIETPQAGQYTVWARVQGLDYTANSFWLSVDDGVASAYEFPPFDEGWVWGWHRTYADAIGAPPFWLDAGVHTLTFSAREAGARLDKILITEDPWFEPDGPTEPEQPTPTPTFAPAPTPTRNANESLAPIGRIGGAIGKEIERDGLTYVPVGSKLTVWDRASGGEPTCLGESESVGAVIGSADVSGTLACVLAHDSMMTCMDVWDPRSVQMTGSLRLPTSGSWARSDGLVLKGDLAYASTTGGNCKSYTESWQHAVDVSCPDHPTMAGPRLQSYWEIFFGRQTREDILYRYRPILGYVSAMALSDPSIPRGVSLIEGGAFCEQDGYVFTLYGDQLKVIDWRDVSSPTVIATLDVQGEEPRIVDGNLVLSRDNSEIVIDINDPANPFVVEEHSVPNPLPLTPPVQAVEVVDDVAFVQCGCKVQSINVSDPAHPMLLDSLGLPCSREPYRPMLAHDDRQLYTIMDQDTLVKINAEDPHDLQVSWSLPVTFNVGAMDVVDGMVVMSGGDGMLQIVDIEGPTAPSSLSVTQMWPDWEQYKSHWPFLVRAQDSYAYVGLRLPDYSTAIAIVDLTIPEQPAEIARIEEMDLDSFDVDGYLLVTASIGNWSSSGDDWLDVWSIADSSMPYLLGACAIDWAPCGDEPSSGMVLLENHRAYLGLQFEEQGVSYPCDTVGGVLAVDLSVPSNPRQVSLRKTWEQPVDLAFASGLLYSAESDDGLAIYGDAEWPEWYAVDLPLIMR